MKTKRLAIKTYDIAKPAEVVAMATVLKDYVVKQKLYVNIKGKNYAQVEGWQFAGFLTGLTPRVESVESLSSGTEIKWKAVVNIYKGEQVMATGIALCSSKEANKKGFDEYAILSMAQTRAIGKAYRNLIGWVMKLAGYQSTPAEEMHKVGDTPIETVVQTDADFKDALTCSKCDSIITKQEADYSLKVFKKQLCRNCQKEVKKK
jgi:hypothetical protein